MLENIGTKIRIKDGKKIFRENTQGNKMYIIDFGKVRLTRTSMREASDLTTTLAVLSEGDFFGEMALFDYGPRSATATAVGDVTLRTISRNDLKDLIKKEPEIAFYFLDKISKRIRTNDELIELLLTREKLAEDLFEKVNALRYPEFIS